MAQEPITSAGRIGGQPFSMPAPATPTSAPCCPRWSATPASHRRRLGRGPGRRRARARWPTTSSCSPRSTPATTRWCCRRWSPWWPSARRRLTRVDRRLGSLTPVTVARPPSPIPDLGCRRRRRRRWPSRSSTPGSPPRPPPAGPTPAQVLAYDLAHAAAAVRTAEAVLDLRRPRRRPRPGSPAPSWPTPWPTWPPAPSGASRQWGVDPDWMAPADDVRGHLPGPGVPGLAGRGARATRHLDADFELVRDTFHRFAEEQIRPRAEHIHRANTDIPEEIISGMAEMGGFGLSVPEEYGGFATGGESDYIGMVVATEELSWGSLGAGGSLITRPEILTRALVAGRHRGAEAALAAQAGQRRGHGGGGGDRARLRLRRGRRGHRAPPGRGRLADQRRQDLVHVRGPGRRAHAAGPHRPRPGQGPPGPVAVRRGEAAGRRPRLRLHPGAGRRGRPAAPAGRMEGRAIDTLGYRGMHSYEVASRTGSCPTPTWSAARTASAGASTCRCRDSRTAACRRRPGPSGVMQAAYEAALDYAAQPGGVRRADRRLPADPGQARPHGRHHPGDPPVRLRGGPADGQGRGRPRGLDGQGLRVPGGRVGDPGGPADPRRAWATPRSSRSAATSSTPGCCPSSKGPTRPWPSRWSPGGCWPTSTG